MLTLGIDTSTDNSGLALIENDIIKAEYNLSLKGNIAKNFYH